MLFRENIAKLSRGILICIGGVLLCSGLLLTQGSAQNYTVNPNPSTYQAVQREVTSNIPANLEEAQCGGWDLDESVIGKVAQVQGFPGHDGIPICNADNVRSGMAMRIESQIMPATMGVDLCGYRSACRPIEWLSTPECNDGIDNDGDGYIDFPDDPGCSSIYDTSEGPSGDVTEEEGLDRLRPYPPFYKILPCQRPLGGIQSWEDPLPIGRGKQPIAFTCGGGRMPSDGHVCDTMEGLTWWGPEPDGIGKGGLCAYMNENWLYGYYEKKIWVGANCEFLSDSYPGDGVRTCRVTVYREGPCTYKPSEIEQTIAPLEGHTPMQRIENRQCCTRLGPIVFSPNGPTCMPPGYGTYDYGENYGAPPCKSTGNLCQRQECLEWTGCVTKQKCDDGNACTVGACDPLTGACSYTNVNCDDGNKCTVEKGCDPQKGCIREKLDCPDNPNPCMQSYCNPAAGCSTRPTICPDDHDKCTTQQCVPSKGGCVSTFIPGRDGCQECQNVNCDDGNPCTRGVCDPDILLYLLEQERNRDPGDPPIDLTRSCQYYPVSCDDGDECTRDLCVDGCGCANIPGACEPDPCENWPDPDGSDRWNCRSCCGETCTTKAGAPPRQYYPIWRFELSECENRCIKFEDGVCMEKARISCDGGKDYITKQPSVNRLTPPKRGRSYLSYYRHYVEGSYKRDRVRAAPKDQHKKEDIPASCYGLYRAYDPKTTPVSNMYKNCVIAAYYGGDKRNFYQMLKAPGSTQEGRGSYYFDHDDIDIFVRDPRFDKDKDLWSPEFANAFSLSNDKIFEERFNSDITLLLFQPQDIAKLEATVQLGSDWEGDTRSEVRRSLSIGSLIRAFDDSVYTVNYDNYSTDIAKQMKDRGYPRVVTTWLQEQESHLHYVVNSSVIRMILPPDWSVGLDPLDPLYTPKLVTACGSYLYENGIAHDEDPRMHVLEVQLQAEDDTIDTIKAFLLRSLMPTIRYEPVPVLIPMGSPTEFRAIAEGWKGWMQKQNSSKAEPLVSMLEEYARYIEEVRTLRGEIAWHASELLTQQNKLAGVIGGWLDDRVLAQYGEFMSQMDFIREMQGIWKSAIRRLRRAHDIDCMPWCHNDRFTTSIYSLLDPWSQRRGTLTLASNSLPSLSPPKGINAVFDFSLLKPPTGILEFPVVEPIQVRIDLQRVAAPDISVVDPVIPILPKLPPIPQLAENLKRRGGDDLHLYGWPLTIGQRDTPRGITFELWSEGQRRSLRESVQRIASRIRGMANEYSLFWKSMSIKQKDMTPGTEQDCYRAHADTCVHAEMDLRERLQRFGARPAVFLFEDFLSIGEFRPDSAFLVNSEGGVATGYGIESCPPEDWTCQLLVQHKDYPPRGWAIDWHQIRSREDAQICPYSPSGDPLIDQLRVCTFNETLLRQKQDIFGQDYFIPDEPGSSGGEGLFPYDAQRNTIVPSFAIPPVFHLIETVGPQKVDDSESD